MTESLTTVQDLKSERDDIFKESMKVLREKSSLNKGVLSKIKERNQRRANFESVVLRISHSIDRDELIWKHYEKSNKAYNK